MVKLTSIFPKPLEPESGETVPVFRCTLAHWSRISASRVNNLHPITCKGIKFFIKVKGIEMKGVLIFVECYDRINCYWSKFISDSWL